MPYPAKLTIPVEAWRPGKLKKLAHQRGIPVTELVRDALDEYEERHGTPDRRARLRRIREVLERASGPVADPQVMEEESMPTVEDLQP